MTPEVHARVTRAFDDTVAFLHRHLA
jgi:hypothetical protein